MAKQLKYVAQECMDLFYNTYKADVEFFDLNDFINHVGNTISDFYQKYYELSYKSLMQEGKTEVVTFDPGMLSEQILEVKDKDGILFAQLLQPVMSFMYDQSSTGIQDVIIIEPISDCQVERSSTGSKWQLKYMPVTNKIWFCPDIDKISFVNKGVGNIKRVRVLYIPSMYPEALIADGIINQSIESTVNKMLTFADKKVYKKSLNQSLDKTIETEIDKAQLK